MLGLDPIDSKCNRLVTSKTALPRTKVCLLCDIKLHELVVGNHQSLGPLEIQGNMWATIHPGFVGSSIETRYLKNHLSELSVKSLEERRNRGFDPSFGDLSIKSSLARCLMEIVLKLGGGVQGGCLGPPLSISQFFGIIWI